MVCSLDGERTWFRNAWDEWLCIGGKDTEEGFRLQGVGGAVQELHGKEKEGQHGERETRSIAT